MTRSDGFTRLLGPRPSLTLVIENQMVTEIWVSGRAPDISIRDYDWGETDTLPTLDRDGYPFTLIKWRGSAWALGLSLHPPAKETPMAQPQLKSIPLKDLHVSKLNMRHSRKKPEIADILPSIREDGLRQTLLVREEGEGYGVIAGRRRYYALLQIAKETGRNPRIPCAIMEAGDDAAAMEASLIENVARLPATEMEQYAAFARLSSKGRKVSEIAGYFGVTELNVRRVLALGALSKPIRDLYASGKIDRETIHALTLASAEKQTEWLRLYKSDNERTPMRRACKEWVTGGVTITTDKALFDLGDYDGEIITDLFGEAGVFADASLFWQAQSKAIAMRVEAYLEAGWTDVQVLERGAYFHKWDHTKRPRTKRGKVYVEIRHDGSAEFHEGYVTQGEARKLDKAAVGEDDTPADIRPEMSGPMREYIALHRHGATRATLLGHPSIALRLMVAHAMTGSALWTVQAHQCSARKEATRESIAGSKAETEVETARLEVEALFTALGVSGKDNRNGDDYRLCQVFSALLAMSDEEVGQVLAFTMAETLEPGGAVIEAVAHVTGTDMAKYWQPEPAFFDLLRDKRAINAMVADIATPETAQSCLTETGKVQKQVIANRITGDGCAPNPDWRPGWMQVPPTRYVGGAASRAVDAWERVNALFEAPIEAHEQASDTPETKAA